MNIYTVLTYSFYNKKTNTYEGLTYHTIVAENMKDIIDKYDGCIKKITLDEMDIPVIKDKN